MTDRDLPIETASLDKLLLDLENYRVPGRSESQLAALSYLFDAEDVLEIAEEILVNGYFDIELPLVAPQDDQYIVLEGNRRVSALKALHNPALVPSHRLELEKLLRRNDVEARRLPSRLRVMVAPSKAAVANRVGRLHTGLSKKAWTLDQQAAFYYSQYLDGKSVTALRSEYSKINIPKFMKIAEARRFLSQVAFSDPEVGRFAASEDLKISTLEYIYSPKKIASLIGMEFTSDGILVGQGCSPAEKGQNLSENEIRTLEYLLSEVKSKRLNTNSPQLKAKSDFFIQFTEMLEGIYRGDSGPLDQVGRNCAQTEESTPSSQPYTQSQDAPIADEPIIDPTTAEPTPNRRGANRPSSQRRLVLDGIHFRRLPDGLRERFHELERIDRYEYPIALSLLMRSVLETTIKYHFEVIGDPKSGELRTMFGFFADKYQNERSLRQKIGSIRSDSVSVPGSVAWFNGPAHDLNLAPSGEDVLAAWRLTSGLVRFMVNYGQDQVGDKH